MADNNQTVWARKPHPQATGLISKSLYVSINSKSDHPPPREKPMRNLFDGQINTPGKKSSNHYPVGIQNELKPHPQVHFPQLSTIKT